MRTKHPTGKRKKRAAKKPPLLPTGKRTLPFVVGLAMSGGKMGEKETGRQTVIARPVRFKQEGFERYLFCVHPHITCDGPVKGLWTVSEYRTGISVLMGMRGKTPKQALKLAKAVLGKAGPEKFKAAVDHALSIYGPRN